MGTAKDGHQFAPSWPWKERTRAEANWLAVPGFSPNLASAVGC